jgi:hypothetical protein
MIYNHDVVCVPAVAPAAGFTSLTSFQSTKFNFRIQPFWKPMQKVCTADFQNCGVTDFQVGNSKTTRSPRIRRRRLISLLTCARSDDTKTWLELLLAGQNLWDNHHTEFWEPETRQEVPGSVYGKVTVQF